MYLFLFVVLISMNHFFKIHYFNNDFKSILLAFLFV